MENTLPILPELIFETLGHCNLQEIWNFARTSRASYLLAFRVLSSEHGFPLSIPYAINSGLAERHKEWGFYDRIDANVKIYSERDQPCSIHALLAVLKELFVNFFDVVTGLAIRVEVAQIDEAILARDMMILGAAIRSSVLAKRGGGGTYYVPLRSLELWVKSSNARSMMDAFLTTIFNLLSSTSRVGDNKLEHIKIAVKWREYGSAEGSVMTSIRLGWLKSNGARKVWLEDKNWHAVGYKALEVVRNWPGVEEMVLDCGLGARLVDYDHLKSLEKLQKLSIPFPYAGSFDGEGNYCCMRSLFRDYLRTHGKFLEEDTPLKELNFHYLRRDGTLTNFTKVRLRKNRHQPPQTATAATSAVGGNPTNGGVEQRNLSGLLEMEDLGDKPTDPTDLASMRELMLIRSLRGHGSLVTTDRRFFNPFMSEMAVGLVQQGDRLEHWSRPEDTISGADVNRSGVECTKCDCIV
ncbi:hypothetical protein TWF718_003320 [Orbilia javanica]|uniref:Uncharacterized protein n=1 Tax=Orbilia javanica TaxID=47235 RepID=A0AAN8R7S7_9PEZI